MVIINNEFKWFCGNFEWLVILICCLKWTWKEILTSHFDLSGAFDNNSQTLTTHTSGPKITTAVCLWVVWQCEWRWWWWVCVFDLTVVFRCVGISYHLCYWCCCIPPTHSPLPHVAWGGSLEMKGRRGVCLCFYHFCICSTPPHARA